MFRSGIILGSITAALSFQVGCQSHHDAASDPKPMGLTAPLDEQYASTGVVLPASSRVEAQPLTRVTMNDVVTWTHRGWTDEQIIDRLDRSDAVFHLGASDQLRLRDAGVSDEVVRAMKASAWK